MERHGRYGVIGKAVVCSSQETYSFGQFHSFNRPTRADRQAPTVTVY
jgi:hypothetical protein